MKKRFKLVTALVIIFGLISVCVFGAYAVDNDGDGIDDGESSYVDDGGSENQDQPPEASEEPVADNPDTDVVVTEPDDQYYEPVVTDPVYNDYQEETTQYYEDYTYAESYVDSDNDTDYNYQESNGDDYYSSDGDYDSDRYVGGGQSYDPPQSTAPSAALYDVDDRKIDDNELSGNDWGDINLSLQSANAAEGDDIGDFSFIQENNSANDNGYWILILGILLLLLGIAGIVYATGSSVKSRRQRAAGAVQGGKSSKHYADSRYAGDYGDGYSESKRKRSRAARLDTDKIAIDNYSDRESPRRGGKRYK